MRSLVLWGCLSSMLVAETQMLMMRDVIAIALKNSPELMSKKAQSHSSQGQLKQIRSSYLPQANLKAGVVHTDIDTVGNDSYTMGTLGASQLLYDFGKTSGAIESGEKRFDASKIDVDAVTNDTIYATLKEFYTVLKKYHLIVVQNESVEINDQQLYRAGEYFKAGVRTKIDVTNAQLELSDAKLALLSAQNDLKIARMNLERVIGLTPNRGDYRLYDETFEISKLKNRLPKIPYTLDEFKRQALQNRSEIVAIDKRVEASRADESSAQGEYLPSLDARADYQKTSSTMPSMVDQWNTGVYLNWNFFSGFQTEGKLQEMRGNTLRYQSERQKVELDIVSEVTNAYNTAIQQRQAIDIRELAIQLAQENLQLAQERYKSGIGDMIELNDAQSKYIESKSNYVITYYDYCIAAANLQHAVGKLAD